MREGRRTLDRWEEFVDLGPGHVCLSVILDSVQEGRRTLYRWDKIVDPGPGHICLLHGSSMQAGWG